MRELENFPFFLFFEIFSLLKSRSTLSEILYSPLFMHAYWFLHTKNIFNIKNGDVKILRSEKGKQKLIFDMSQMDRKIYSLYILTIVTWALKLLFVNTM